MVPTQGCITVVRLLVSCASTLLVLGCTQSDKPELEPSSAVSASNAAASASGIPQALRPDEIQELLKAVDKGDPGAMFKLSRRLAEGRGIAKDQLRSDDLLAKAAERGHLDAMVRLASTLGFEVTMHSMDSAFYGVTKAGPVMDEWRRMKDLYRRAAAAGSIDATESLGFLVARGFEEEGKRLGIRPANLPDDLLPSPRGSLEFFATAAAQGSPNSMVAMWMLYREKRFGMANVALADHWHQKIVSVADPMVAGELAMAIAYGYMDGRIDAPSFIQINQYVPNGRRLSDSLPLLTRAAQAGHTESQCLLARVELAGDGLRSRNPREAARWLEMASRADNAWAQRVLAGQYLEGDGVLQDFAAALALYEKAARNNPIDDRESREAQQALGKIYEAGISVPRDLVRSHAWYNLAVSYGLEEARESLQKLTSKMEPGEIRKAQELAQSIKASMRSEYRKARLPIG